MFDNSVDILPDGTSDSLGTDTKETSCSAAVGELPGQSPAPSSSLLVVFTAVEGHSLPGMMFDEAGRPLADVLSNVGKGTSAVLDPAIPADRLPGPIDGVRDAGSCNHGKESNAINVVDINDRIAAIELQLLTALRLTAVDEKKLYAELRELKQLKLSQQ